MHFFIIIFALFFSFFPAFLAKAYLDPGVGNMLVQLVAAGLAGALVLLKIFWSRIKSIGRKQDKQNKDKSLWGKK